MTTQILQIQNLPLHLLMPAPWNVTEPNRRSLSLLTQNIKENGFAETALVVPIADGKYRIISGHDKVMAATNAGLTEIPCALLPESTTEEDQKYLTVRMNVIKKKMDGAAFFKLFKELSAKQAEEVTKAKMMFTDESKLEHFIAERRKALPTEEAKQEFDKQKPKIKTVDDIASVVQEMFTRSGSTSMDKGYTVFSYGGQEHIYVAMDKELQDFVHSLLDRATAQNKHITEVFKAALGVNIEEPEDSDDEDHA